MRRLTVIVLSSWIVTAGSLVDAFELATLAGERTTLASELTPGAWTLVQLWTTDCAPCERDKPVLDRWHRRHAPAGSAAMIGIALDGRDALALIEAARQRTPTSYPTLVAFDDVFEEQFQGLVGTDFRATPTYLLYSPAGDFQGAHVGPVSESMLDAIVSSVDTRR
mgnify:CR=1 FL=1